ncbi:uncharacterized protein BX663DRAFT_506409 [Cokeromyces recurvatus]|uniref:uncharacterized protein n=1 Tax=Cokeromyces recurvatus TaxID=90255 RepID=UPI00221FF67F|nr:uncharacterized protein BX663DRAFT_506409 [Cokeromyces recurvatus]KAI7904102.1 hypothetical protein BX663DRAFT_506409 [Cokeromyces recurvatus]
MSNNAYFRSTLTEGSTSQTNPHPLIAPSSINTTETTLDHFLNIPITNSKDTQETKDISCIPPTFFVGAQENEDKIPLVPETRNTRSLSIGYGNRRLSGILTKPVDKEKKPDTESPAKRIVLGSSDAKRGIFGDGNVQKKRKVSLTDDAVRLKLKTKIDELPNSRTIRIFGYPVNLANNVIHHFLQYGKIEHYVESPGNWISITYEKDSSALAALKSNGTIISKNHLIGVILEDTTATPETHKVIPVEGSKGVFKAAFNIQPSKPIELGSGRAGISARDPSESSDSYSINGGILSYFKELISGW